MNDIYNKKAVVFIIIAMMIIGTLPMVFAHWMPGDGHKMHFPQLPDEDGWDVCATQPVALADDWMCNKTGPITDIHFWGSWKHGIEGVINSFVIAIHTDIPADPPYIPYSKPGTTLWEREFYEWDAVPIDPPCMEGWYDPSTGEIIYDDHQAYFQYNIVDIPEPFIQEEGTIYWLAISAIVADPINTCWGWKSSEDHWNDDACWAYWGELNWIDLWEPKLPSEPIVNDFWVAFDPYGQIISQQSGGFDYYDDGTSINGWYFYPYTEWWNIWFYDHPFDPTRYKEITIWFDAFLLEPSMPAGIEVAVNWATDQWPPDYPPPIPPIENEELYIGRHTLFQGDYFEGHYEYTFVIPDYNPEWVSVDVRGFNFIIPMGQIIHDCLPKPQSLDLSFVITGEEPCTPDIDVEKYVWNSILGDWDDADTENDAVDIPTGANAEFLITIHNNGTCCDLINIYIWDIVSNSMEFIGADPYPDEVIIYPHGTELYWYPDPLLPSNWINISVFTEVVGEPCSIDENYVYVEGYCQETFEWVWDEDSAFIHATPPPSIEINKWVWDNDLLDWVEEINANISNDVLFKIIIYNNGGLPLHDIMVTDYLPPCLEFMDSWPLPDHPDPLTWYFLGPLWPYENITIEILAHVISEGINMNEVYVEALSDMGPVIDYDTATVIVIPDEPDTIPPEIIGLTLTSSTPLDTEAPFGWENISCIVTDDTAVDTVQLNITFPDLHMEIIPMALAGGDTFFCNISLTDAGNYIYHVWANDTSNNQNTSASELFALPMNEDVNGDGCVEFWDLVAISLVYGDTGPPGWCREDVNNGGMVEFWDLVAVSLVYGDCWNE